MQQYTVLAVDSLVACTCIFNIIILGPLLFAGINFSTINKWESFVSVNY